MTETKTKEQIIEELQLQFTPEEVETLTVMAALKMQADYYKEWNRDMEAQLLYDALEEMRKLRKEIKRLKGVDNGQ